ncbi:MAG TPA: S8 family serine peptidase, partial [Dehalococcoidia bacterium]|nr:S8 family serine peptidase [Dehalococcoidia bacterium]
ACSQRDTSGHGTHVTGTAAGNGGGTAFRGMAPRVDIAVIKPGHPTTGFNLTSDAVIDAWSYLVNLARSRNQPIVINNSFAGQFGSHDGRGAIDVTLDALAGPGVIFVVAAGNDGDEPIHTQTTSTNGGTATIAWNHSASGRTVEPPSRSILTAWTNPNNQITYNLSPPGNVTLTAEGSGACPSNFPPTMTATVICEDRATGYWVTINNGPDSFTGQNVLRVQIRKDSSVGVGDTGAWSVQAVGTSIGGNGVVDAYLGTGGNFGGGRSSSARLRSSPGPWPSPARLTRRPPSGPTSPESL